MRRVVVQMQASVDGYVSAADPELSWQVWHWGGRPTWDEKLIRDYNANFADVDTILLSRTMVTDGYLDHWARSAAEFADDPALDFARRVGEVDKIVVSRAAVEVRWPRTTATTRPLDEVVAQLRAGDGGTVIAFGGVRFAAALAATGLVDEFQFYVNPTAVGDGGHVLAPGTALRLLGSTEYPCGVVLLRYAPAT